jgi:hypothetical protein
MAYIPKRLFSAILLTTFFLPAVQVNAQPDPEGRQDYINKLEQRISDLETLVNTLVTREGEGASPALQTAPAPVEATQAADDEWGAPAVAVDTAKGRDEEARRRLIELETWQRKTEAKSAKETEEQAELAKFDFSGKYKLRLNSRNNLHLNNPAQFWTFDDDTFVDQRFQLKIDAEYGPLSSVLVLDKGNFVFDWKEGSEGTLDRWGEFQTVTSALVRELYVQYTGGFVVKGGRQSLNLGNGGVVLEGPSDALKLVYPLGDLPLAGQTSLTAAYIAVSGGYRNYNDFTFPAGDRSAVLGLDNKLDGYLLSFDLKPHRNLRVEPYFLKVFDRGSLGDTDLNLDKDFDTATIPRDGHFEPLWAGLAINGSVGNYSFIGDLVYLTGSATSDRDYEAYAALLRGDYSFSRDGFFKNLSLGLEAGSGSGNSAEEKLLGTGDINDFTALFLCKERRKFGNIFSQDLHSGFFFADSNLANVTFARAIVGYEPYAGVKGELSLVFLRTTESVQQGRGPTGDWSRGTAAFTEMTNDIGWEVDFNLSFPIMKRLTGFFESGYFVPGDVYRLADGQDPDPAYVLMAGIEFVF